jgi:hypothetical protein
MVAPHPVAPHCRGHLPEEPQERLVVNRQHGSPIIDTGRCCPSHHNRCAPDDRCADYHSGSHDGCADYYGGALNDQSRAVHDCGKAVHDCARFDRARFNRARFNRARFNRARFNRAGNAAGPCVGAVQ